MKRDRVVPELEIELRSVSATSPTPDRGAPRPKPTRASRRQLFVIATTVVVTMSVVVVLGTVGKGSDPKTVTPSPPPTVAPEPTRTPTPGILGSTSTRLLLWGVDPQSRLQVLDLDSGELRVLGDRGGILGKPVHAGPPAVRAIG